MEKRIVKHTDPDLVGKRVIRGMDWSWDDQDGGEGNVGTITFNKGRSWVTVKWDGGSTFCYRAGGENDKYDLYYHDNDETESGNVSLDDFFKVI